MTQRAMGASVQFLLKMLLMWVFTWLLCAKQGYPLIFPDKGKIVPSIRGAVYYVGENITLHCYSKTTLTAGKFTFAADVNVPSQYVTTINDTYIRMDRPADATDYLSTIYNCVDLVNDKVNIIDSQSVYTEYRPQNVTDILCVHFNSQHLNCTWNLGSNPYKFEPVITSPTRYLTSVKSEWSVDDQIWNDCSYSSITSCTIENYNNVFVFLRVNVTNVSRRDSAISTFRVDHYVVPPTSISNLTLKGLNSTCAVLFWIPSGIATADKYSIFYGSDEISDTGINIETASENITVCELVPFRKYTFIVQAFSNSFPSQPTTGVLIAAQDLLENVTSVTNVTCIYYHRLHVICTWSLHSDPSRQQPTKPSEVRHLTSIMPQWSVDEKTWNPCSFTTLTSCTIKNFVNVWVAFRVNVTNSLSHKSSVIVLPFLSINDFEKPAPVSKLTVRRLTANCAQLSWSQNIVGLTYSISKSSDIINYKNEVNTTGDNTTICNLSVFQKYTFRVQAFPQKGFPSEPVTAILNEQDGLSSEEVSGTYYIGEKITLHCHSFENFTRGMFIYGSDIEVPSNFVTIVNATYIRLDMPVDKHTLSTVYYCLDKKDKSITFVGIEQIHTDYRPQNVTNVTCVYLHKKTVNCSWNLGPNLYRHPAVTDSHSSYLTSITSYWSSDNRQWKACNNTSLTSCDIGRYNNLLVSLRVNVTNMSRRESAVIELSNLRVNDLVETTASTTQVTTSHGHHDITCTESRMEFSIPLSSPHTSETATLSDPNCQINLTRTHVRGGVDLNSCGTTVQFQNDSVIFRNAIIFSAPASSSLGSNGSDDSVSQYQDIIPIECVYNRIATVHLSYMPVVRRVLFTESGVGQFSFNIQQFWDASFTSVVSDRAYPLRLEQDADIFIQLSVGSEGQPVAGHKEIGMEVQQCLVSPSSSVIEAQLHYYPLIQDGCPASSDVHIIPNTNASDSTVMRFRFRAVNFFDPSSSSSSSLVFVHCRMGLCLTGSCKPSAWTCLTPPARRVRRDVDQSRRAAHQLSTGPFLIMADEASASSSSTTATVMAVVSTSVATVAIVVAAIALIALRRRRTTARN